MGVKGLGIRISLGKFYAGSEDGSLIGALMSEKDTSPRRKTISIFVFPGFVSPFP
jgi:hypothetical protein